jgi:DNA repair exonuclease SbcCD ATPase subunit
MTKIIQLEAQNVKRLSAVHLDLDPHGNLVVIGGDNEQGKSSVLDCIEMALAGASAIPSEPIRRGTESGQINLTLDSGLTIERKFAAGRSTLVVKNADGFKASSPQAILDKLYSGLSFDPLSFAKLKPTEQVGSLRKLVGLDFTGLDAERKTVFDERTAVNREIKATKARADAIQIPPGTPDEEVSVATLLAEFKRREAVNKTNDQDRATLTKLSGYIEETEAALDADTEQLRQIQERIKIAEQRAQHYRKKRDAQAAKVATLQDANTSEIQKQLGTAEQTNAAVRKASDRRRLLGELEERAKEADALTQRIEEIDGEKQAAMESAAWPIDGLSFGDGGLTYKDLPFDQASSAEKLRVSVAMGLALNPDLRVLLIRDGSLIGDRNLAMIAELAREADAQLWIERVGEGAECSVIIEDGQVKEVR